MDKINLHSESLEASTFYEKDDNLNLKVLHFRCWQDINGNIPNEHTHLGVMLFKSKKKIWY